MDETTVRKHPNDMTREELLQIVRDMSWLALDLAQHLCFTNEALKEEYRADAYKKACRMAYELTAYPYDGRTLNNGNTQIAVFGGDGLTVHRGNISELAPKGKG